MEVFGPQQPPLHPTLLSAREREVLDEIATGATNPEIAKRLYLSPHTVKEHTSSIYRKLGVRNRAEAVKTRPAPRAVAEREIALDRPPDRSRRTPRPGGYPAVALTRPVEWRTIS